MRAVGWRCLLTAVTDCRGVHVQEVQSLQEEMHHKMLEIETKGQHLQQQKEILDKRYSPPRCRQTVAFACSSVGLAVSADDTAGPSRDQPSSEGGRLTQRVQVSRRA